MISRYLTPALLFTLTCAAGLAFVACNAKDEGAPPAASAAALEAPAPPTSAPPAAPAADAAPADPHAVPADPHGADGSTFGPVTSRGGGPGVPSPVAAPPLPVGAGAADGRILAPGASFDLPAGWKTEEPSSSMRLAQASVPGSQGPALLAVFYFGAGGGGGVDANLQRWVGQMNLAAGSAPEQGNFNVGDYRVTWVHASGTLKGGTMGGPAEDTPNSALLGAVVEGEQGPWFFKMTGPGKTITEQREAFLGLLRSARPKL